MPEPGEPADVVLIDTTRTGQVERVDQSRGWNPQQGTMFYWHPAAPATQFFFNDRDPQSQKIFTVLYDVAARKRVREFRFDETPVANSGVAQKGGRFLAINYGRLARLRPVTGNGWVLIPVPCCMLSTPEPITGTRPRRQSVPCPLRSWHGRAA